MRGAVLLFALAAIVAGCGSAAPSESTPPASSGVTEGTAPSPTLVPGAVTAP
jgi:hypothetical protein